MLNYFLCFLRKEIVNEKDRLKAESLIKMQLEAAEKFRKYEGNLERRPKLKSRATFNHTRCFRFHYVQRK